MIRITLLLLGVILAAAAAGRYKAEAAVRETRKELQALERDKAEELRRLRTLRMEIAYLENPDRLARIVGRSNGLGPLASAQVFSAAEYRLAFGGTKPSTNAAAVPKSVEAIAIAELGDGHD